MNCRKCKVLFTEENSSPSVLKKGAGYCRVCSAWFTSNRRYYSYRRNRLPETRHRFFFKVLKSEAVAITDIIWNLNFYRELIRDNVCHYCLGPLNETGCGLDAVDPLKEHYSYNVVPSCWECNLTKNNTFSYNEMMLLSDGLRKIRKDRVGKSGYFKKEAPLPPANIKPIPLRIGIGYSGSKPVWCICGSKKKIWQRRCQFCFEKAA